MKKNKPIILVDPFPRTMDILFSKENLKYLNNNFKNYMLFCIMTFALLINLSCENNERQGEKKSSFYDEKNNKIKKQHLLQIN